MMTNLTAPFATCYNTEISMLGNLQIVISALLTCQSVFMPELSNLSTAADSEKKCNGKATQESSEKCRPEAF